MKKLCFFLLLAWGPVFALIIPTERRITWEGNVGIPDGVPNRTAISATITASTYGNGTTDATNGIQTALNNCPAGQVVYLSAGTYRINSILRIPDSVTLRGAGPKQTILDAHGSSEAVIAFGQDATPYSPNSKAITGGSTAGSNTISLASASGISVGSYLLITELNDTSFVTIKGGEGSCTWCDGGIGWNGTRALGQVVEVTSVNGTAIGIAPSLYINYAALLSPLATPFSAGAKYAGVEDLQVYANNTGYTTNIIMNGSAYCWVKNIESNYADGDHFRAFWAYRCEVRDSYFHDAFDHSPGQTDADVFIADKSSGLLIENNIMRRMHVSIMLNWGAAGNVIGYNYSANDFDESAYNVVMGDLSMHGSNPMFNLYEGNIATSFHPDGIWGSNSYNTLFRSWLLGTTKICYPLSGRSVERSDSTWWACQANRAINVDFVGLYYNIIGNVSGSTDLLKITSYNNGTHIIPSVSMIIAPQNRSYDGTTYCYCFGYSEANDDGSSGTYPEDNRLPFTTAILHGNYDYASDSTKWDPTISDHILPASLYLPAKPSWWGSMPWPPIGPDVSPMVNKIPAQVRYEALVAGINSTRGPLPPGLSFRCLSPMKIEFQIQKAGHVRLEVFSAGGKRVRTLVDAYMTAGKHTVIWNLKAYPTGVYVYKLTAGKLNVVNKEIVRGR
ncbi:MAG: glycosyl hydrolase family 28-related protein [Chitinivibrionales bacterium]